MTRTFATTLLGAVLLTAATALAGPPLICQKVEIGKAKSLPWRNVNDWDGSDSKYDVANLTGDTLALLTAATPLNVRMETMRRAAIYAARHQRLSDEITARLLARTVDAEAAGKPDALAWFDAGYFTESIRQITFVYRYNMLSPGERAQWKVRGESLGLDGRPWIDKAIRLGGKGMEVAISKIEDYRQLDLKRDKQVASTK